MRKSLKPIREQVIVITGASSGIGLATAQEAARKGARVVLFSRDEEDLRAATESIRADGGEAIHVVGDVGVQADIHCLAETAIREFGGFDTWVNNAGISIYGLIEDVDIDDARRMFETNYWGTVYGSLTAVELLRSRGGALINVGSILSETGYPLQGHYAASKHAVKGFTDSLRLELEKDGSPVSVTLVEPTAIDTPFTEHARNYLATEPKHAPPVYAPEVVARAIVHCAEHPHRTLRVGGGAKMFSVMEKASPRLADRTKMSHFEKQHSLEPARDDDTLFAPRPQDGKLRGNYPGRVMQRSAYTEMAMHRGTTLGLAVLGLGLGLAARAMLRERAD